jgi:DNA-binding winged helix-turn-helix (wHTH) protein
MRYRFAEFVFDLDTGELQQGQVVVPLRRQTLRLLQALVAAAPALLTRDQLLDEVWGRSALSPNALPQAISELRRALGDDAEAPRFIDTRRGLGYRFIAAVEVFNDQAPMRVAQRPSEPSSPAAPPSARPGHWLVAVLLLASVVGIGSTWALRQPSVSDRSGAPAVASVGLAIAPFPADSGVEDWVPHAALELFAQSLQSERLTLYRSDTLGISPQHDAARWQHQAHDLLGASHALSGRWHTGTVDGLRLDLSVLDLATGQILASRQFSAASSDLDRLVASASAMLADTLRVAVGEHRAPGEARLSGAERSAYWSALAALAQDDAPTAAAALAELHEKLGRPAWIEPDMARALTRAQQRPAAQALLEARLQQRGPLPLGERLRTQAELARLQHRPAEAAAARRALAELYPQDIENWIELVDAELDALQGISARSTLAQLSDIARAQADPRLHLLRARLSLVDNEFAQAQAQAALAMQQARAYDLPHIAIGAALAESDSLSLRGDVAAAADVLQQAEQEWSERTHSEDRFSLRMRHLKLLRLRGDLSALSSLHAAAARQATSPIQQAQLGIEHALLQSAQGQHDQAMATVSALSPSMTETADPALRISWHDARAVISLGRNEVDLARQDFDAAFALARRLGHERFSAPLQVNAGMLLARQRRYAEADAMWNSALEVFIKLGNRRGQATCLGNLAASASIQNRPEQSRELNTQALALFRELGITEAQARTAYNLALEAARDGRVAVALDLFAEARSAWLAGAQLDLAFRAAVGETELTLLAAQPAAALTGLNALPADDASSALSRAALRAVRAKVVLAQGDVAQSRSLQLQALNLRKESGSEAWTALSELDLLRLDWLQGKDATKVQVLAEALARRFTGLKETRDAARARLLIAEAQLSQGQRGPALNTLEQVQQGLREFADRPLELDLAWVSAWAAPPAERRIRLDALRDRAKEEGYLLTLAMVDAATDAPATGSGGDESLRLVLPPYARRQ